MMTQSQYEQQERRELLHTITQREKAPLSDRKEARDDYRKALQDVERFQQRMEWLLEGAYGKGAYDEAHRIIASKGNREAGLSVLLAVLEWQCPNAFARQAWNELDENQQKAINAAINEAMQEVKA